ncbi:hypothetical protein PBI_JOHANN_37 [Microbacterium phage Johann]|uniref:Uncharacterized protein n=2 Tax=Goodmanvirus goodman TaxID=2734238 RepID=A0A3G3M007_9CAUD|nr:hypothetical protein HOU56_gp37 [Microbacterium phage Goodman]AYQ99493.1 hypothetical protein PBI_GOODMAN_37 [Microbacterium phage Goodman]AYQ99661.1 hypothetical protein PBI_JOHANN_37 [Microbacterium phage Johann]
MRCHYSWRRGNGEWVRCRHNKGVDHGEKHESPDGVSWVHVSAELDIPYHRWVI